MVMGLRGVSEWKSRQTRLNAKLLGVLGRGAGMSQAVISTSDPLPFVHGFSPVSRMMKDVTPPPWERAEPSLKVLYGNLSLMRQYPGRVFAFSINIEEARVRRALFNERGPLDHLRRELVRKLEGALSRRVHVWMAIETKREKSYSLLSLHLHGAVGLADSEVEVARGVFHALSSGWHPQTAVRMRELYSASWGGYSVKDVGFTELRVTGGCFSMSRELSANAREIYSLHAGMIRERLRDLRSARQELAE